MSFQEFCDMWTRKNLPIVICPSRWFEDMFDKVDEINEGKANAEDIQEYVIGAIIPYYTQYRECMYIRNKWVNAKVTHFYVGTAFSIVWIEEGDGE